MKHFIATVVLIGLSYAFTNYVGGFWGDAMSWGAGILAFASACATMSRMG
jgi:hypothetical protein